MSGRIRTERGRPGTPQISVKVETHDRLKRAAAIRGANIGSIVDAAINRALDEMERRS